MKPEEVEVGDIVKVPGAFVGKSGKDISATVLEKYKYHILIQPWGLNYKVSLMNYEIAKIHLMSKGISDSLEEEYEDVLNELGEKD